MAEVVLFHHAQGLTPGVRAFADHFRAAGHVVHTPDLYEGKTFATLDEGVHHGNEVLGSDTIIERGAAAAKSLPAGVVYGGFSLGNTAAQNLTQNKPGAKGALMFHDALALKWFGGTWPEGVPAQIHAMEEDKWFEAEVARELERTIGAELYLYPGDKHLFTDSSLPDYDAKATALLMERVLAFLGKID
jgi:dienelactone hydrolase